jgi:Na+-translocating ferredoxin:NAD+ oxidoreductase subunit D
MLSKITVSPAPHISRDLSTQRIMLDVILALAPAMIAATIFFRERAVILIISCVLACVWAERICNMIRKQDSSVGDLSAALTGVILALSLPPAVPWWVAVLGGVFAIVIAKMVFGGLGANVFNPAMAGRAFLTASFGMLMTTWTVPATVDAAMPLVSPVNTAATEEIQAITQATPLAWSKEAVKGKEDVEITHRQTKAMFWGNVGGCLGETSFLALAIGGVYLLIRRTITWHTPAAVMVAAAVFAGIFYLVNPDKYASPVFHLLSGGMIFCAFFIATDPVTAPLTNKGMLIFGAGVGILIMMVRLIGEYPEGVMYAVLVMNAFTPLIDRFCKLVPAGGKPHVK